MADLVEYLDWSDDTLKDDQTKYAEVQMCLEGEIATDLVVVLTRSTKTRRHLLVKLDAKKVYELLREHFQNTDTEQSEDDAHKQGFQAGKDGKPSSDNCYSSGSLSIMWMAGWQDGWTWRRANPNPNKE